MAADNTRRIGVNVRPSSAWLRRGPRPAAVVVSSAAGRTRPRKAPSRPAVRTHGPASGRLRVLDGPLTLAGPVQLPALVEGDALGVRRTEAPDAAANG